MPTTPDALKLAASFDGYFRSANDVDVPAHVSVPRDEWRELHALIEQQHAAIEALQARAVADKTALNYWLDRCTGAEHKLESLRAGRAVTERAEAALSMLEDPSKEMLEAFQRGFMAQLKRRKHYKKGWEISAEQAGIKAMLEEVLVKVDGAAPTPPQAEQKEFDHCDKSPTGKHSESWFANGNCCHCKSGAQPDAPLMAISSQAEQAGKAIAWMHTGGHVQVRSPEWAEGTSDLYTMEKGWTPLYTNPAPQPDDARDARRYRLIRRGQHWSVINGLGDTLRGDELDAAIDAVITLSRA